MILILRLYVQEYSVYSHLQSKGKDESQPHTDRGAHHSPFFSLLSFVYGHIYIFKMIDVQKNLGSSRI